MTPGIESKAQGCTTQGLYHREGRERRSQQVVFRSSPLLWARSIGVRGLIAAGRQRNLVLPTFVESRDCRQLVD